MEICLGTVQFGLEYGVTNKNGRPSEEEISTLLQLAYSHNIRVLDTAVSYGESERVLGDTRKDPFLVVTKLPPGITADNVDTVIFNSLKKLKLDTLHTVLFHDPHDLLKSDSDLIWNALINLKKLGYIHHVGVSVYFPEQLYLILDKYQIDSVQFPLNCFDQRFIAKEVVETCLTYNLTCYARSLFLQGTLLASLDELPMCVAQYKDTFKNWHDFCLVHEVSLLEGCLLFAHSQDFINYGVIGLTSVSELKMLLKSNTIVKKKNNRVYDFSGLAISDEKLIHPTLWTI